MAIENSYFILYWTVLRGQHFRLNTFDCTTIPLAKQTQYFSPLFNSPYSFPHTRSRPNTKPLTFCTTGRLSCFGFKSLIEMYAKSKTSGAFVHIIQHGRKNYVGNELGLKYALQCLQQLHFGISTVWRDCLVEQSACSSAEGSGMHVEVHERFPLVLTNFKQNWN